jgi:hypothetical protein
MHKTLIAGLAFALMILLAGCSIISLDTKVDGEITLKDRSAEDSNGYWFYSDLYTFNFKEGVTYYIELWCPSGDPIHFQIQKQGVDIWVGDNSADGTYSKNEYPAPVSGNITFDIYLRGDYVGSGVPYSFQISEK